MEARQKQEDPQDVPNHKKRLDTVDRRLERALKQYTDYFGSDVDENRQLLQDNTADEIFEMVRAHRRSTKGVD